MSSAFRVVGVLACLLALRALGTTQVLRVCADSNNLPYSNDRQQGFENKLAELVARDLGRPLEYVWWPHSPLQAHKLFRSGACDLMMEAPSNYTLAETTHPYYTSSYVFVTRRDRHIVLRSLRDQFLREARIGFHGVGDGEFIPPAQELASEGIVRNVSVYSIFGNLARQNPSAELIEAVAHGDIDVAIAWGPLAGYFARNSTTPLDISLICPDREASAQPLSFDMSMGVRRGDDALREQLETEIMRRKTEIRQLLVSYGVPMVDSASRSRICK
jgi:mxaJ protein